MNYAFLDIETSGLEPHHEPIEVAYILEDGDSGEEILRQLVTLPFDMEAADAKALEINGWGVREFTPTVDPSWFAHVLHDQLKEVEVVGNNVQFDMIFLARFLQRHGLKPSWHHHVVDVKAIAGAVLGLKPPWNSEMLCEEMGIDMPTPEELHTAMGDAEWNKRLFHCAYAYAGTHHR